MKNLFTTLISLCIFILQLKAQSPPYQINYQGVARDVSGTVIQNTNMRIRLTVYDLSPSGPIQYSETRMVQTNKFGLFTVAIGSNNGVISSTGKLSDVNWSSNSKYLGVEIDPKGGNNFIQLGISQLLSVPYSLYSLSSKDGLPSLKGHTGKILTNNGLVPKWDTLHIPIISTGAGLKIVNDHISVVDTSLFNASKILNSPIDTSAKKDGYVLTWNENNKKYTLSPRIIAGSGLQLSGPSLLSIKDTAIFNASKIMGATVDITGRQNNNVLSWDSTTNKFKYVPVEIITGPNMKFMQNGNSFGTQAVLGTNDSFALLFKTNNKIVGRWETSGELSSTYFRANKQFLGSPTFLPQEPIILPNGELGYNGEFIPPYSFLEDPKSGLAFEPLGTTAVSIIHLGKPLLRTYWEGGKAGDATVIQGLGGNRLSIESSSNMVHIAQTSRFEWEGFEIPYIDFIGFEAGSFQGKTFRFTSDITKSVTPLAVMPHNHTDAFHVIDSVDNVKALFTHEGWLGVNVLDAQAPLHISNFDATPNKPVTIFENSSNQEIFTTYNNRKSYFGERVYYRSNPVFRVGDDLALVPKKYVDDLFIANGLTVLAPTTVPASNTKSNNNILVNPNNPLINYTIDFPIAQNEGEEVYIYFGGVLETGVVVSNLEASTKTKAAIFPGAFPKNIQAGEVLCFRWNAEAKKWFRKS